MSSTEIGSLIKEKRLRINMTPKELSDAVGLPKYGDKCIRDWEKGEAKPSSIVLKRILNYPETIPYPNIEKAKYNMIDLFAGIGGTRLGFVLTNKVKVVFTSEINKYSIKTYKANFGEDPKHPIFGDITELSDKISIKKNIPHHDILVGGFPCQPFSLAGLKKGFDDIRGTLFFNIAQIIKIKNPKAILLENVKNLLNHDKGNTYKVIYKTLTDLGYQVYEKVLAAKDFGVPQNRERIYIVCFDRKQVKNSDLFSYPTPQNRVVNLGAILESESDLKRYDDKYTISDKLLEGHKRRKQANKLAGKGFGYGLFNENSPYTNTLSARYYRDGSEILIEQKGKNPRKITPREAARLQGFPDNFLIPVSDTQAYKQFGNSVAVPVIHAIAQKIIEILDQNT